MQGCIGSMDFSIRLEGFGLCCSGGLLEEVLIKRVRGPAHSTFHDLETRVLRDVITYLAQVFGMSV